jgi:N-methylhydantoinase A
VGATFDGPAVVEQPDTTSVLPPGTHCRVDEYNNLIIQVDR